VLPTLAGSHCWDNARLTLDPDRRRHRGAHYRLPCVTSCPAQRGHHSPGRAYAPGRV